jgi:alkylation response protein AidB-like acyl-CoA dehydrogenase
MDFEPNETQRAVLESAQKILTRLAGPKRARSLWQKGAYDGELDAALSQAGFVDLKHEDGPLTAAMVLEKVAAHAGMIAFGAQALVCPKRVEGALALALRGAGRPVRFAGAAGALLMLDGDGAFLRKLAPGEAQPVRSNFGYPFALVNDREGERIGGGEVLAWAQVALAVELAGTMRGALELTNQYVKDRHQFGRAIGSFQALQHRLAECAVLVEGSRWLAYEAAWSEAPSQKSATCAAHASFAAQRVFHEMHQMTGAIGFTREHDLHVFTMRLIALGQELGGLAQHRRLVARAAFGSAR